MQQRQLKITILGCGSSAGVPIVGCDCKVCKSKNRKDKRLRSSILIEQDNNALLVDASPDLRVQALSNKITKIDAVLFTHAHFDHVSGIDELRAYNYIQNKVIDVYSDRITVEELKLRFHHAFLPPGNERPWVKPCLRANIVNAFDEFSLGQLKVQIFPQTHGKAKSLGLRIGDFAYSTDLNELPEDSLELLFGLQLWIVDCLGYKETPTHSHLAKTLKWVEIIKPKKVILTHMGHEFSYADLKQELPEYVEPGFDGQIIFL